MNKIRPFLTQTSTHLLRRSIPTHSPSSSFLLQTQNSFYRKMSTSTSTSTSSHVNPWGEPLTKPISELGIYLAILPDFTEGSKRMEVRPLHIKDAGEGHTIGWIISAGATFEEDHSVLPKKMTGSWFLFREENLVKARERLTRDAYVIGGAWDMSKCTITPVAVAAH